jgi:hypothetical protein
MKQEDKLTRRLALLEDVNLSPADLAAITPDIHDLDRIVAELEEFGQRTPWISQQAQPSGEKIGHDSH